MALASGPASTGAQDAPSAPAAPAEAPPLPTEEPPANVAPAVEQPPAPGVDLVVVGQRQSRSEDRSTSDFELSREVLKAAPRQEGAELLRAAPGVYVGRGEGGAVAHNYMLRGFDAEHGQDLELRVGGLPINLPAHLHGQGYADLGFLIGDTVRSLRVREGVSDPRQGDFAVAGSIDVGLGVEPAERGLQLRSSFGSFGTFRQLALWAPREGDPESFGAVHYQKTRGFGQNRAAQSGSAILQQRFGAGALRYRALGILYAARSDLAGVVRDDDVARGALCFACVYPQPTARAQNAFTGRLLAGLFADYAGDAGANGQLGLWLGFDDFRLQENFTGFIQQSRTLERVAGRGDLIEQQNRTLSFGLTGRYRSAPYRPLGGVRGSVELGADGRLDVIDQAQSLLDASVRNQTWDRRVDAAVRGVDLGLWGDLDFALGARLRVRAGLRGDVLAYDIEDRLGNFAPLIRPRETYIVGFRRSALGLAAGPRASAELTLLPWLTLLAAYGEGYRSPQARLLSDGEQAPFTKVRSADLGVRVEPSDVLRLTLGAYYTHLSDDVAFDASEGGLTRVGATRRMGAVAHASLRPAEWFVGSVSVTFVDATLREPPPPTAEEPQPPFVKGQRLPFVPPVVVRADLGAQRRLLQQLAGADLRGRLGLGFSFLSARPLPYAERADPLALLDASAGLEWGRLSLVLEVFNALDARYAAVEYAFASDWDPNDGVRPRTPARHLAAGAPRSVLVSLGVIL